MFMTETLQLIDKNLENFEHWVCVFDCVEEACYCKIKDPVSRCACYKLYS